MKCSSVCVVPLPLFARKVFERETLGLDFDFDADLKTMVRLVPDRVCFRCRDCIGGVKTFGCPASAGGRRVQTSWDILRLFT